MGIKPVVFSGADLVNSYMPAMSNTKPVLDDTESVEPTGGDKLAGTELPPTPLHKTPQQTQSTSNLRKMGPPQSRNAQIAKPQSLTLIGKFFVSLVVQL